MNSRPLLQRCPEDVDLLFDVLQPGVGLGLQTLAIGAAAHRSRVTPLASFHHGIGFYAAPEPRRRLPPGLYAGQAVLTPQLVYVLVAGLPRCS
jgi:hypothetical protein